MPIKTVLEQKQSEQMRRIPEELHNKYKFSIENNLTFSVGNNFDIAKTVHNISNKKCTQSTRKADEKLSKLLQFLLT